MEDFAKEELKEEPGVPVCEKCGNIMIKEAGIEVEGPGETKASKGGEWVCPHCQGEIDFLGEDDE